MYPTGNLRLFSLTFSSIQTKDIRNRPPRTATMLPAFLKMKPDWSFFCAARILHVGLQKRVHMGVLPTVPFLQPPVTAISTLTTKLTLFLNGNCKITAAQQHYHNPLNCQLCFKKQLQQGIQRSQQTTAIMCYNIVYNLATINFLKALCWHRGERWLQFRQGKQWCCGCLPIHTVCKDRSVIFLTKIYQTTFEKVHHKMEKFRKQMIKR